MLVISIYLRPDQHRDHLTAFGQIRQLLAHAEYPFIIAGDFNKRLEQLAQSGLLTGIKNLLVM